MKIEIDGDPLFLQRPQNGKHGFYDPQFIAKKNFAHIVKEKYKGKPIDEEVSLDLAFYLKMAESWSKKKKERLNMQPHTGKKDLDNAIKFILDALNGVVWLDDSIIFEIHATKHWAYEGKTVIEVL